MNIADRALRAHEAKQKAEKLEFEAGLVRRRALAVEAILAEAQRFGVEIDPGAIGLTSPHNPKWCHTWMISVPVDDDFGLELRYEEGHDSAYMKVDVAEQLYWDLPPRQKRRDPAKGGTYGCYGLGESPMKASVKDLAHLGQVIIKVRDARASWREKWIKGKGKTSRAARD